MVWSAVLTSEPSGTAQITAACSTWIRILLVSIVNLRDWENDAVKSETGG